MNTVLPIRAHVRGNYYTHKPYVCFFIPVLSSGTISDNTGF